MIPTPSQEDQGSPGGRLEPERFPEHWVPEWSPFRLHHGRGEPHYTPWLVVRYNAFDEGDRPLTGGTVFWESPDVWCVGSQGFNQPVVGEPTKVYARVNNFGLQEATGILVDFWWADPSLAITHATAHKIGTGFIPSLPAASGPFPSSTTVQCPNDWTPVVVNNGHECLLAEAFIPLFDDLTAPMDPTSDRHVGQKNENLVLVPPGQPMKFRLWAVNISPLKTVLTLTISPLIGKTVPPLVAARREGAKSPLAGLDLRAPDAALPLAARLSAEPSRYLGSDPFFARRLLSMASAPGRGGEGTWGDPQVCMSHEFAPWEVRGLELEAEVPADARPGQVFGVRVVQSADRMVTGGYTIHVVAARN